MVPSVKHVAADIAEGAVLAVTSSPQLQDLSGPTKSSAPLRGQGLFKYAVADSVTAAEITWSMYSVEHHMSIRCVGAATTAFSVMFPDSEIASSMRLERTKVGYLVSFGLAPYFRDLLTKDIQETDCFVACFNKSLNKYSQDQQMDICIRYWSMSSSEVYCRYFSSAFLGKSLLLIL